MRYMQGKRSRCRINARLVVVTSEYKAGPSARVRIVCWDVKGRLDHAKSVQRPASDCLGQCVRINAIGNQSHTCEVTSGDRVVLGILQT